MKEYTDGRTIIGNILNSSGIGFNYTGFWYLIDSVEIVLKEETEDFKVTKDLYPELAARNRASASNIEHAIRNAIRCGWEVKDSPGCMEDLWENFDRRPTNSEFISKLAEHTRNMSSTLIF